MVPRTYPKGDCSQNLEDRLKSSKNYHFWEINIKITLARNDIFHTVKGIWYLGLSFIINSFKLDFDQLQSQVRETPGPLK